MRNTALEHRKTSVSFAQIVPIISIVWQCSHVYECQLEHACGETQYKKELCDFLAHVYIEIHKNSPAVAASKSASASTVASFPEKCHWCGQRRRDSS